MHDTPTRIAERALARIIAEDCATYRARVAALEAALRECASPFRIGDQHGIEWENIAREFNRRQKIARSALGEIDGEARER